MSKNGLGTIFYLLILVIVVLGSCANGKKALEQKYTIAYKSISGIEANLLSLDIYPINSATTTPVIIWVHGGGWAIGDKAKQINNKINLFRSLGYTLVSVNYRLSTVGANVKFPDHINDLADAVTWVYKNIEQYNGDKTKIVIMGHSAGAQLVSLLATDASYLNQRNLSPEIFKAVISLDTEGYDVLRALETGGPKLQATYQNAFGNDKAVAAKASAINYIADSKNLAKYWLFAERGNESRKALLADFISRLSKKGIISTKIDANGLSHGEVNRNIGAPNEKLMTNAVVEFLKTAFK